MNTPQASTKPRILVAPLDWGLGHATRCIPVIRCLQKAGAEVILAAEGNTTYLLQTEFPDLPLLPLPGYGIAYGKSRWRTLAALGRQLPKLLRAIKGEEAWLREMVTTYGINVVISDNRYGLHHPAVYSVLMTHQLQIQTPFRPTNRLLQQRVYRYMQHFDACWVPDVEQAPNLAGALAHPKQLPPAPVTYIGPLSRFAPAAPVLSHYVLVLLSGPEPQRTLLENALLQQAQLFQMPILVVRGLPGHTGVPQVPYHVTIVNHLPTATLQHAIENARFVISRSGYSSVMDLLLLQKRCIFIPTPMQTEQEYLAKHLMAQNWALCLPQQKFQLKSALALAERFPYQFPQMENSTALQDAVTQLLQQL